MDGAHVVATLYRDRSPDDPVNRPGVAVPPIVGLELVGTGHGSYKGHVAGLDTAPGTGYVTTIDADLDGDVVGHWEEITRVRVNR